MGRRGSVAGIRAALRFLRTDGGYHAAALTYYLIFALFPAGALIYALLGIFSAPSRRSMTSRRSSTSAGSTTST